MRVPIITRDKHTHRQVRYGWLSPDGLLFGTYQTKEQADSAVDGEECRDRVIYLNPWREIIRLTNIGEPIHVGTHSSAAAVPQPQRNTIRDSAG